jgi:hypothetical protein
MSARRERSKADAKTNRRLRNRLLPGMRGNSEAKG